MSICCECCVLSGTGQCIGLITHPEECYRCVESECDREASTRRRPWPTRGCSVMKKLHNKKQTNGPSSKTTFLDNIEYFLECYMFGLFTSHHHAQVYKYTKKETCIYNTLFTNNKGKFHPKYVRALYSGLVLWPSGTQCLKDQHTPPKECYISTSLPCVIIQQVYILQWFE
jgi:hypothetical protein